VNEEWLSAHLDGELSSSEAAELEAVLASDPALAAIHDDLARVRAMVRGSVVEPPQGTLERIVAGVERADEHANPDRPVAPVYSLASRRRVPTFAAVAAALVIIASVVGGLGGSDSLPALGDLIAQHEAAASVIDGEPMPDHMDHMGMDEIPMDEAMDVALPMPADFSVRHAFASGSITQLVYMSADGEPVSVFRHEGETDLGDLGNGSVSSGPEAEMWSARRLDAYVAVVDGTGYVWVIVSAEPHDDMMDDMMDDLPTRSPSIGERLRDTADAAVEPFRFWN
jgi:hypothetical protein